MFLEAVEYCIGLTLYLLSPIPVAALLLCDNLTKKLFPFRHVIPPVPKHVFITGGSMGVGFALAQKYAMLPSVQVVTITGRDEQKLFEAKQQLLRSRFGLRVHTISCDVGDKEKMRQEFEAAETSFQKVDVIIANAGIMDAVITNDDVKTGIEDQAYGVVSTNILGLLNTVTPAVKSFMSRPAPRNDPKQIIIIGSIAGLAGSANLFYGASKAFVNDFARTLRRRLAPYHISVTCVMPYFVDTPMTARFLDKKQWFRKLFTVSAEHVAKKTIQAAQSNRDTVVIPWFSAIPLKIGTALPFDWQSATYAVEMAMYKDFPYYNFSNK